ncbi:MAG: hypothetical protein ACOCYP_03010 [Planctomycetota bacterium]
MAQLLGNVPQAQRDDRWLALHAGRLAATEHHADAVSAFIASSLGPDPAYLGRNLRYLRTRALAGIRAYARAQQEWEQLSAAHPYSPLTAADSALAIAIETRLAEGVSLANLRWHRRQALDAQQADRPGLAIEHHREWLLLARSCKPRPPADAFADVELALGADLLTLDAPAAAIAHLARVPPGHQQRRGALFQALSSYRLDRPDSARERARWAALSTDAAVRERANQLLRSLDPIPPAPDQDESATAPHAPAPVPVPDRR